MNPVYITAAHTITGFGTGLDSLYGGLVSGKHALSRVKGFDTQSYASPYACLIPEAQGTHPQCEGGKPRIFALADSIIKELGPVDKKALLITASTKAGVEGLGDLDHNLLQSGLPQSGLIPSELPQYIARKLGLERSGFNINSACASSTIALAKGAQMIKNGQEDMVVICAMDLVSEFVFSGFSILGAMSPDPARPFDKNRNGLTLGEGAAILVLMSQGQIRQTNSPILAELAGWGIASDAHHLIAPAKDGRGLKLAIRQSASTARIPLEHIQAINTHGTGTQYNDAMELGVIHQLFNPRTILANSIKGAIGHTLGAAGAIDAALCIKMLEKGILPGTKGLKEPENMAEGIFNPQAIPFKKGPILTTNSGFGGINAALILQGAKS